MLEICLFIGLKIAINRIKIPIVTSKTSFKVFDL